MVNSLGEYNISQSSSADINNIKWSQKKSRDIDIPKKRKTRKISSTNIIYTSKIKVKQAVKIFKVKENDKSKKKNTGKKFQNSSVTICKIKQGFTRHGR